MKLTWLLQHTVGKAGTAIEPYALTGGAKGYKQAHEILQTRFGNHHLVAERILKVLDMVISSDLLRHYGSCQVIFRTVKLTKANKYV